MYASMWEGRNPRHLLHHHALEALASPVCLPARKLPVHTATAPSFTLQGDSLCYVVLPCLKACCGFLPWCAAAGFSCIILLCLSCHLCLPAYVVTCILVTAYHSAGHICAVTEGGATVEEEAEGLFCSASSAKNATLVVLYIRLYACGRMRRRAMRGEEARMRTSAAPARVLMEG